LLGQRDHVEHNEQHEGHEQSFLHFQLNSLPVDASKCR
jgi:hypothetical protein